MLTVTELQVAYGDIQVVWDVSFQVEAGQVVALIGPNGAGKTTTLKAITGLLPLKAGSVTFKGHNLIDWPTHEIVRQGLVLVPESKATFATLTVQDNLRLGSFPPEARQYRTETVAMVYDTFPRLAERKTQKAGTLSGGERQMLAIGKALMARPELLILDEPSLGLAPLIVENIFEVITQISQQGVSILLVEQNVQQSLEIADFGYVIEVGRIVNQAPAAHLLKDDTIQAAYVSI
jgi:branched-chain amino acid transport system ATP-binding protein